MRKSTLMLSLIVVPILLVVAAIIIPKVFNPPPTPPKSFSITMWGTKSPDYLQRIIDIYRSSRPYVTITYTQIAEENYRDRLLEAWALGTGPDLFEFPAAEIKTYIPFLEPAPKSTPTYTYTKVKRLGIMEETQITKSDTPGPTAATLAQSFVDTVSTDALSGGKVYGLPLSMPTLVLYSNRELLNQARISLPATNWNSFIEQVPELTVVNTDDSIIQSGASLGTGSNVNHAPEILSLLISQTGGSLFNKSMTVPALNSAEAERAITFYTAFGDVSKEVYSWNSDQEQALNAFAAGKVAYYIGTPEDGETITKRSTSLRYDVSAVPQVNEPQPVNVAVYNLYGVYKGAASTSGTWNFLQYLAGTDSATRYYNSSLETPARKDVLNTVQTTSTDPVQLLMAGQALTAKTWYPLNNEDKARSLFESMLDQIHSHELTLDDAIKDATDQLRLIMQ